MSFSNGRDDLRNLFLRNTYFIMVGARKQFPVEQLIDLCYAVFCTIILGAFLDSTGVV